MVIPLFSKRFLYFSISSSRGGYATCWAMMLNPLSLQNKKVSIYVSSKLRFSSSLMCKEANMYNTLSGFIISANFLILGEVKLVCTFQVFSFIYIF